MVLDEQAWKKRRCTDGFVLLVAHPGLPQSAARLWVAWFNGQRLFGAPRVPSTGGGRSDVPSAPITPSRGGWMQPTVPMESSGRFGETHKVNDLIRQIASGESETLELKRSTAQLGAAAKTICAFLNGQGWQGGHRRR